MLILLAILIFIYNFAKAFCVMSGIELSPAVEFLYAAAFPCAAIWWLRSDVRKSAITHVYCQGLLMGAGWFVIIPYHLLKTRGLKGLLPLLLLVGSFFAAPILAAVVYYGLFASRAAYSGLNVYTSTPATFTGFPSQYVGENTESRAAWTEAALSNG